MLRHKLFNIYKSRGHSFSHNCARLPVLIQSQTFSSSSLNSESQSQAYEGPLINGKFVDGYSPTSSQRQIVETLMQIPRKFEALKVKAGNDNETFGDELGVAAKRGGMFLRQIRMEEEQHSEAVKTYIESTKQLVKMGRGTGLKHIQRIMLKWYEPLIAEITAELALIKNKAPGKDRVQYGPCLLLVVPEKLAVITLHAALNSTLKTGNSGVTVMNLAKFVGDLVEAEVNIMKLQKGKDQLRPWQQDIMKDTLKGLQHRGKSITTRIGKLIDQDEWTPTIKVKLGAALISLLLRTAKTDDGKPAYVHDVNYSNITHRRNGSVRLDEDLFATIADKHMQFIMPRYLPMLIPPNAWDNKRRFGCYFRLKTKLMRTFSQGQHDAVSKADMGGIIESLNYLGQIPWRINTRTLDVVKEAWKRGMLIGELPSTANLDPPRKEDCYRVPQRKKLWRTKVPKKSDSETEDATTTTKPPAPEFTESYLAAKAANEEAVAEDDLRDSSYWTTAVYDKKFHEDMTRRIDLKNSELHSLRCDMHLKIWVAEKFSEDQIYFPYSLDFRGRAYPVPPNLNHLGSDLCRGILYFGEAKPLGANGLTWLKVHLANLFGNNKISHLAREKWVDDHLEQMMDSAARPLEGEMWWTTAEEPFQALSTCFEIKDAIDSGNPATFMSRLPVHQDGSCNGLQHYAALGKDEVGGNAVNLTASEVPQDVYSKVLDIVLSKINDDAAISEDYGDPSMRLKGKYARLVQDVVNRKVIKQTVMTSVYGVTRAGASAQVQARLQEKMLSDPASVTNLDMEREVFSCASYVANLTLDSLREMFNSAKSIMDWLGTCAALVSSADQVVSWITPMGLPVIQPYRKPNTHTIKTVLQSITLAVNDDSLPVSAQKQRSAFPPNFVHSLDATHMLMTSLKMKENNLTFAAVHDSYWTHPSDVDTMNVLLRECFVDLYKQPILESLRDSLELRYPNVEFPPIPERGNLDITSVHESQYFFH